MLQSLNPRRALRIAIPLVALALLAGWLASHSGGSLAAPSSSDVRSSLDDSGLAAPNGAQVRAGDPAEVAGRSAAESANPGESREVTLGILDWQGLALADAEVQSVSSTGELESGRTDSAGRLAIALDSPRLLVVVAEGHLPTLAMLDPQISGLESMESGPTAADRFSIQLDGAGRLSIAIVNESGVPQPDVVIRVSRSSTEMDPHADREGLLAYRLGEALARLGRSDRQWVEGRRGPTRWYTSLDTVSVEIRRRLFQEADRILEKGAPPVAITSTGSARTDEGGVAHWDALPTGGDLTWALDKSMGERSVLFDPHRTEHVVSTREGKVMVRAASQDDAGSGPFRVNPGSDTWFTGILYTETGIRGRLADWKGEVPASARVLVQSVYLEGPSGMVLRYDPERFIEVEGAGGAFEILGLAPGPKQVTATWQNEEGMGVVVRDVELPAGEVTDLGLLTTEGRKSLSLSAIPVDRGGTPIQLSSSEGGEHAEHPSVGVLITQYLEGSRHSAWSQIFSLPFGIPTVLRGVGASGKLEVMYMGTGRLPQGYRIAENDLLVEFDLSETSEGEFRVPLTRTRTLEVTLAVPQGSSSAAEAEYGGAGDPFGSCDLFLVDVERGTCDSGPRHAFWEASLDRYQGSLPVEEGRYRVFARNEVRNLFAFLPVERFEESAVSGALEPGIELRLGAGEVQIVWVRDQRLGSSPLPLVARASGGERLLRGLPPGATVSTDQQGLENPLLLPSEPGPVEWELH